MLLADTSAWIEFLRDTGSPACGELEAALRDQRVVVTDPVILELMSGARPAEASTIEHLLNSQRYEPVVPRLDWLDAATIYRSCRRDGVTIRSQVDCLVAVVAIRAGLPLLQADRDFAPIAARTPLQLVID